MKIILSRKGFDSSFGRYPSLIYENKLISLPIPSFSNKTDIKYSEIFLMKKKHILI